MTKKKKGSTYPQRGLPIKDRFMRMVTKTKSCWLWNRGRQGPKPYQYGIFRISKEKTCRAHRLAYELFKGEIGKMCVLHTCDTPLCVNPEHLFLGTIQDNSDDMVKKGRHASKLTQEQAQEIRRSKQPYSTLSKKYKISYNQVRVIKLRQSWKNLA